MCLLFSSSKQTNKHDHSITKASIYKNQTMIYTKTKLLDTRGWISSRYLSVSLLQYLNLFLVSIKRMVGKRPLFTIFFVSNTI